MLLLIFLIIILFLYFKYLYEKFEISQINTISEPLLEYKKKIIVSSSYGWTDVINFLPLLSYFAKDQDLLVYYIISINFKDLLEYYIRTSKNIKLILWDSSDSKYHTPYDAHRMTHILKVINFEYEPSELKLTGMYDADREDKYRGAFYYNLIIKEKPPDYTHDFVNLSYSSYGIDPMERINSFKLDRDYDLENIRYEEFIAEFGDKYILHHEIPECIIENDIKYINLAERTSTFFDYVKILENAIEIHLLDSVWGAVCYLLDAKYKLFQNKKIYLYAKRGFHKMFVSPIELPNWTVYYMSQK